MDLFHLEVFLSVARERSFSRAAQQLGRTQSAVSQIVRKLELELGETLLDRSSRAAALTDAGRVLEGYATKLLNLRRETSESIADLRRLDAGRLSVAANEFTSLYLLSLLHTYRQLHPRIHIAVQRALASRIPHEVLNHGVELGVLTFAPEEPSLRSVIVYRDELAFVVNPQHPLAGAKSLGISDLGAESFIAHNVASPYRAKVLQAFARHKTPLNMDVELPSIEAIKRFVAMGNGVALVPALTVEAELERGELVQVPVRELAFQRQLRIVFRKGAPLSHAAQALLAVAKATARDRGGRFLYQAERAHAHSAG